MRKGKPSVLVVDRAGESTRALVAFLRGHELEVVCAHDSERAFNLLDGECVDGLVTELKAERIDGMSLLARARERNPEVCAIVVTERAGFETAIEAMRRGAADFQIKPLDHDVLFAVLHRGLERQRLAARVAEMEVQLDERLGFERLTGRSRAIVGVLEQVRHIAPTRAAVLIEGEPGTGMSLVARAIHRHSPRHDRPFARVHCAAVAGGIVERELFGDARSPSAAQRGGLEIAAGGTLFLADVDALPPPAQVGLLRVLRDRSFERVGGDETLKADVRLIAATHRDLAAEVRAGRFREDLHDRLGVARIQMPSLRERREDIPLLVDGFIRDFNHEHGRKVTGITRGALDRLVRHPWPGNVRELEATIEGMVLLAREKRPLDVSDLPEALREGADPADRLELVVGMTVDEAERRLIAATLRRVGGDKPRAAAMLGIGLRTLYRKIERYGLR